MEQVNSGERRFDVAVIGGGIVGMATAMTLAVRDHLDVVVLEAESELASHQTGHNSGVIHSGLYYKPASLKARLCAAGRQAMYDFCVEHAIAHDRCGKIVVATSDAEIPALDELERRGNANGLAGMKRLNGPQLHEFEPHVTGIAGLYVPQTGIVDYSAVTRAMAGTVERAGGTVRTNARVMRVQVRPDELVLDTPPGEFLARGLVNCGGLQSDRVARLCGVEPGVRIIPFRGEYYKLSDSSARLVRNLIYPVPDPRFPFLGVHFTRMIHGGVEAGPNAVLSLARHGYSRLSFNAVDTCSTLSCGGFWRMARRYWRTGAGEVWRSFSKRAFLKALRRLIPELQLADLVPGGAGVRAQAMERDGSLCDDFRIVRAERMVHVLNAPSPGATASIAIGRHIADLAVETVSARATAVATT